MLETHHQKRRHVEDLLVSCGSVLVACSGGVDSVLLAAVAATVLGDKAVAATAVSPSLASGELEDARAAAKAARSDAEGSSPTKPRKKRSSAA